jgi:hypothetical protein
MRKRKTKLRGIADYKEIPMADYDPHILQKYADDLYSRARAIIVGYGLLGFVIGCIAAYAYSEAQSPRLGRFGTQAPAPDNTGMILLMLVGFTLLGIAVGVSKAFKYKLEAQQTLCQMKIEENIRALLDRQRSEPEFRRAAGA